MVECVQLDMDYKVTAKVTCKYLTAFCPFHHYKTHKIENTSLDPLHAVLRLCQLIW